MDELIGVALESTKVARHVHDDIEPEYTPILVRIYTVCDKQDEEPPTA